MLLHNIGAAACFLLFRDAKSTAQRVHFPLRGAFFTVFGLEKEESCCPGEGICGVPVR
jgi:hypothetical protein